MEPTNSELYAVTYKVAAALDKIGARYFLGGSVASAIHGEARATRDVDFIAALLPHKVESFVQLLGPEFYADTDAIRSAVQAQRSFNIIHQDSMVKVDLFVFRGDEFGRSQFARRQGRQLDKQSTETIFLSSPEDTVLAKLRWYREGGEISDRQWNDVLGVLKVQAPTIDRSYLRQWANELGITDLLRRAFADAGLPWD